VNYLSHVLLTENLLPLLPENTGAVINVASIGQEPIDFSNLMLEKGYEGFFAYKRSKTALIMYTIELANRLKSKGIKINAIHPASLMNTKMVTEEWDYTLTTVEEGAEAVENLLFTKTTGEYFDGKRLSRAIAQVYDQSAREKLMEITMDLLKDFIQE
jgi:NAD(P)-dependent dehydrogenase (short-subunit alcohol dehydrogenase family)